MVFSVLYNRNICGGFHALCGKDQCLTIVCLFSLLPKAVCSIMHAVGTLGV